MTLHQRKKGRLVPSRRETHFSYIRLSEASKRVCCNYELEAKNLRAIITKQKREILRLKAEVRSKKLGKHSQTCSLNARISEVLSGMFSPGQIQCILNKKRSMKWKEEDLRLAITLRYLGSRTYNYLRCERNIPLPAPSTLSAWTRQLTCKPGVLSSVVGLLKAFLHELPEKDRLAVISFDEMSLKKELAFDKGLDSAIGPHKQVQVCMIRGLIKSWKQIVFYDFDQVMRLLTSRSMYMLVFE